MRRLSLVFASVLLLAACGNSAGPESPLAKACAALAKEDLGFAEVRASWHDESIWRRLPLVPEAEPAFCQVDAVMKPAPGSAFHVVYRLPESWNGKLYGIGGGGWAGDIYPLAARDALIAGYATMQTDAGKNGGNVYDNRWLARSAAAAQDFSYRAIHEMTVGGKLVAAAYYGRAHDSAMFVGCSTGGRMAMMEAQRFPEDYDAIVAGSPVQTLQTQITGLMASNLFAASGAAMSASDLRLATDSAVAACDADDGLEDGLISDPRSCRWDPATIRCNGGKRSDCLAAQQVAALQALYRGIRAPDGEWALFPISRGGETAWGPFVGTAGTPDDIVGARGLSPLKPLIAPERKIDWARFTAEDAQHVRDNAFARMYEAKDPDLTAFFARGGKLLMWNAEGDVGPSAMGTIEYARAVLDRNPAAADQFRMFLIPAAGHCGDDPTGGNEVLPLIDTVEAWQRSGRPPDTIVATLVRQGIERPVCAWPKVAHYRGSGEPDEPASWSCERSPAEAES